MGIEASRPPRRLWSLNPAAHWIDLTTYILISGFAIFQLSFYQRTESFEPDSSFYIGLAHSMVHQGTYEFNFKPHVLYPPGFPAILALLSLIFGTSYKVFILSMPLFGAAGLIISYLLVRQMENRALACAGSLLLASTPYFFSMTTEIINADLPFLVTSMLTLFLGMKLDKPAFGWEPYLLWIGFVLSLIASLLIRTVGIALLFGLGAWIVISYFGKRDIRHIVRFAPVLILGGVVEGFWFRWTWKVKHNVAQEGAADYLSYVMQTDPHRPELGKASLTGLFLRVCDNLVRQSAHLVELISRKSWVDPLWYSPLIAGCIIFLIVGLITSLRQRGGSFAEWYFICYAGIYLLWPFDVGPRFLLPAFPLTFLFAWRGVVWVHRRLREKPSAVVPWGILISVGLLLGALVTLKGANSGVSAQAKLNVGLGALSVIAFSSLLSKRVTLLCRRMWGEIEGKFGEKFQIQTVTGIGLLVVLILAGVSVQLSMAQQNLLYNPAGDVHRPSAEAASWIAAHTASNDTVIAGEEAIVHRISGRKVAFFPVTNAPDRLLKSINGQAANFLIVVCERASNMFPTEPERLRPLTSGYPGLLRLAHEGPCYQIFRIDQSAAIPR
jgi:4-amino-4-deoxy-L-arabinose transferase-like glycosyltransferase